MISKYALADDGIITSDEIRQILERYRIGKKPLAKLLGWGETTIIRYMEGDIPTKEYSNKLRALLDNPEFYFELLEDKRDCLTKVAFKKSKMAVISKIMSSKIYVASYYLINKSGAEMCASYLQFLLYYIQAFSLALYDEEIFQEDYIINNENMPYLKLYKAMKRCGVHNLEVGVEFLTDQEKNLIDAVYEAFTWYGPKALMALIGLEKSLLKKSRDRYSNKIISKENIQQYFLDICKDYRINSIADIGNYPDQCISDIRGQNI